MAGTKEGGKRAALTNKMRHGKDFYRRIGKKGGQNSHTGGFAANRELAKIAGAKGGRISKRGPAHPKEHVEVKRNDVGKLVEKYGTRKVSEECSKSIHLWQRIYRQGRTTVDEEKGE